MSKKSKKILIVDDNPMMQKVAIKILSRNGFDTVSCFNGKECINKAKVEQPDAILMDVILPDGDGKDLAVQLKKNDLTKDIPVIFTTNTVGLEDDKGYEVFKIDGVLYRAFAKPLHDKKIVSVIKKEINRMKFGGPLPKQSRERA